MGMSRFERLVATCKCDFAKNENGLSGENDHQESEPLSLTHSRCKTGRLPSQMQGVLLKTCNVVGPTNLAFRISEAKLRFGPTMEDPKVKLNIKCQEHPPFILFVTAL